MYNSDQKQFIFRQSTGVLWNFYHDEKQGLCYSTLTKRNTWTNPVSLHKNAHQTFFAEMDEEDRFHILFQDSQGNIHYSYLDGDSIKTVLILNSKTPSEYNKYLYTVVFKNNIHFFYILKHDGSYILAYQVLSDGKISNPRVIDYVAGNINPYTIIYDQASNIYVFYQSSDGKHLQLGYKKYNVTQKFWSEFNPVTKYDGNCEYAKAVMDNKGIIHLCYQRHTVKGFEMVYQQKVPDKNLWTGEVIVHFSAHPFDSAAILWLNGNIIVYWVRDDVIYYSTGSQSGNLWSKPSKYNFPVGRQLICMSYGTNNGYEAERIIAKDIPGSFIDGLKLAFHQQSSDSGSSLTAEELRNLILDSLKMLKTSVEELKETNLNLQEELSRLNHEHQEMEKELIKCTVKLNSLENQSGHVKSFNSRFESIGSELKDIRSRLEALDPGEKVQEEG